MYAARPAILRLTGRGKTDDKYFTQTLLPDYLEEHPRYDSISASFRRRKERRDSLPVS